MNMTILNIRQETHNISNNSEEKNACFQKFHKPEEISIYIIYIYIYI